MTIWWWFWVSVRPLLLFFNHFRLCMVSIFGFAWAKSCADILNFCLQTVKRGEYVLMGAKSVDYPFLIWRRAELVPYVFLFWIAIKVNDKAMRETIWKWIQIFVVALSIYSCLVCLFPRSFPLLSLRLNCLHRNQNCFCVCSRNHKILRTLLTW